MKNMFYLKDNLSNLCAEGGIRNLMGMLQCSADDMSTFWELATSPLLLIKSHFKEDSVPKAVSCKGTGIDSIQKCLWILGKKFKFATIPALATSSLRAPRELPFPIRLEFVDVSRYHTYN